MSSSRANFTFTFMLDTEWNVTKKFVDMFLFLGYSKFLTTVTANFKILWRWRHVKVNADLHVCTLFWYKISHPAVIWFSSTTLSCRYAPQQHKISTRIQGNFVSTSYWCFSNSNKHYFTRVVYKFSSLLTLYCWPNTHHCEGPCLRSVCLVTTMVQHKV
jgi:hypothetical protein